MSLRQFNGWRAYADLEPFDEQRADLRAAQITQAVHNGALLVASKGSRSRPTFIDLKDCVLKFGPPEELPPVEQRRAQIKNTLKMLATAAAQKRPKKKGGK